MISYIDLFAGTGGWEAGIQHLGWKCLGLYELDEVACKTLRSNFNDDVHCVDLSKHETIDFPKVDLVIGSPPCQGFSNEGYKNKSDIRNNLVWSFLDIVQKIDPDVWIFENVPGFKRLYKGEFFHQMEDKLQSMEYLWDSFLLDSSDFGVPQSRKRFIAIGSKIKKPVIPEATHSDLHGELNIFGHIPKTTLWDAISDLPQIPHGERIGEFEYISPPLNEYQEALRINSDKIFNHTTQNHSDRVLQKIQNVPVGGNMASIVGKYDENKQHYEGGYRRAKKDIPSYTAYWTRGMTSIHPELDRFLSPRECARIQSFPDSIIFKGTSIQNYTLACNAVPPLLSRTVCESIINNKLISLNQDSAYTTNRSA